MLDRRRHAPVGRIRTARPASRTQGLPHVYRGRARRALPDIYDRDHNELRRGGRFRWLLSTCLAATVGALAIGVVIFGSLDGLDTSEGVIPALEKFRETRLTPQIPAVRMPDGLNWSLPKSDKLQVTAGAMASKHIIHEQVQVRRDNRPFIQIRPYVRVVARLSDVPSTDTEAIPAFNPFKLYASASTDRDDGENASSAQRSDVAIQVLELLGGILPGEDGQELETHEVVELVSRAQESEADPTAMRPSFPADGNQGNGENASANVAASQPDANFAPAPNTTLLSKTVISAEEPEDLEQTEVRVVKAARGDTLARILQRQGAENWQARAMQEAAKSMFPESALAAGHEVHVTLVPSLSRAGRSEPARFSVFTEAHEHKVTVYRDAAGEFVATSSPYDAKVARAALGESDRALDSSLYAGIYHAGLQQGLDGDTILQILRINAYDVDFRRRIRHGDSVDLFFDVKDDAGPDSVPGELLFASLTTGGESHRFWRFRTPDGEVDYYDEFGNNSKKFLMRRPIRGENVRLTSGFGMRQHPVFNVPRMHTGVDWAAPVGTPILAAGNGVIEDAGRKGQYGIHVRIRHGNGYQTTYSHMTRLADMSRPGARVRQGDVIGYVGCTGVCSGPHLHYEVLVNSRFVDALQIQVPRARQLTGRLHAEFQKERARVDDLMRRAPVMTASR